MNETTITYVMLTGAISALSGVIVWVFRVAFPAILGRFEGMLAAKTAECKEERALWLAQLEAEKKARQTEGAAKIAILHRLAERIEGIPAPPGGGFRINSHTGDDMSDELRAGGDFGIPPGEGIPEEVFSPRTLALLAEDERDAGHTLLGIKELHAAGVTGEGVLVAVLDTGVQEDHPDLKDRMAGGADFTGSRSGRFDYQGHGSHCAGIVAASSNGTGVVGVAPAARIWNGKVLGDSGSGSSAGIARGIRAAVDAGADIISMSLGGPQPDEATRAAVAYAASKGVWVFAAAGNDGPGNAPSFPGNYENVVCVAACDSAGNIARFSSRNVQVDIAAPGVQVISCYPGGRYARMSGTSMATPYMAGVAALVRGECKKKGVKPPTADRFLELVKQTARDAGVPGVDPAFGAGIVDPAKLIAAVLADAGPPVSPPPPPVTPGPGKAVKLTHPDLTAIGVAEVSVLLAAAVAPPKPTPGVGGPLDGLIPDWVLPVARFVLPILKRLAEKTNTPVDDLIVDFLAGLIGQAVKDRGVSTAEFKDWWPIAVEVLKVLLPLIEEYVKGTPAKWDDILLRLLRRILGLNGSPEAVARLSGRLAVEVGLPTVAA